MAGAGAALVVADVTTDAGEETIELIKKDGGRGIFVRTDVSQPQDVDALLTKTVTAFGRLDWAVNAAGYPGLQAHAADLEEADFDRV